MNILDLISEHSSPTFDIERGHWVCKCGANVKRSAQGWERHLLAAFSASDLVIVDGDFYRELTAKWKS